jgi:hypothetical protein
MDKVPWIGLAAVAAMFLIPFLPNWVFEGPRTIRHWPRQHVCACCNASWSEGHMCMVEPRLPPEVLQGELRRVPQELTSSVKEDLDNQT